MLCLKKLASMISIFGVGSKPLSPKSAESTKISVNNANHCDQIEKRSITLFIYSLRWFNLVS
jgi:hypothetical protein